MSESMLALPKRPPKIAVEKTPPRKAATEKIVLDIMFAQGAVIKCGCGCGRVLTRDNIRREHVEARKLCAPGKHPDRVSNQSYWARDPCSLEKDKVDIKNIAKGNRIRGETKQGPKAQIKSRGFQKGQSSKLKSASTWPKRDQKNVRSLPKV